MPPQVEPLNEERQLNLLETIRLYPITWVIDEPFRGIVASFEALQQMSTYNETLKMSVAMRPSVWNNVTGWAEVEVEEGKDVEYWYKQSQYPNGGVPPKDYATTDEELLRALLNEDGLIVLAEQLNLTNLPYGFSNQHIAAMLKVVQDNRRIVIVASVPPPDRLLPQYIGRFENRYKDLETDIEVLSEKAGRRFNAEFIPPLRGLNPFRAQIVFRTGMLLHQDDNQLKSYLYRARRDAIAEDSGGVITMSEPTRKFDSVVGVKRAKYFLQAAIQNLRNGEDVRGVLLLGVQGCGKSSLAEATAAEAEVPFYSFDYAKAFGSYVGQTENNVYRAINMFKQLPSGIIRMEEFEKLFSGSRAAGSISDAGTASRSGAYILDYLNNPMAGGGLRHLIIATCNDVNILPPEWVRAMRWSALLWFGIPPESSLQEVLTMYRGVYRLKKNFGSEADIVTMTPAEIQNTCLNAQMLHTDDWDEAVQFVPILSKFRGPDLQKMEDWAKGRTTSADYPEERKRIDTGHSGKGRGVNTR